MRLEDKLDDAEGEGTKRMDYLKNLAETVIDDPSQKENNKSKLALN